MKRIQLSDNTLALIAQNETHVTFKEKLEIARLLDELNVAAIETASLDEGREGEILLKTIASSIQNSVLSCTVPLENEGVERAWQAISAAKKPRLNIAVPVSVSGMEYTLHKKPAAVLEALDQRIKQAKALCADVECTLVDATRAEEDVLCAAIKAAIGAGATAITLADTAGEMLPDEMACFVKKQYEAVPELKDVLVGVCCSDQMHMAEACAFQAVCAGVDVVKTCVMQGDLPGLQAFAQIVTARGDKCGAVIDINATALQKAVAQIESFQRTTGPKEALNGAEEAAPAMPRAALDKGADIASVQRAVRLLGYDLSDEDMARVYESFVQLAEKRAVESRELDAIVASVASQVPPTYRLVSYVVNNGNVISATAHVVLEKDGVNVQGLSTGDGPIDAAFMAIEKILGHHCELDDFQIQSVTSGREALGEAVVKLREGGRLYSGRGTSTDIIGASIRAYLNALNKIVYRESAV